jgi:molybdopterin-binding protein
MAVQLPLDKIITSLIMTESAEGMQFTVTLSLPPLVCSHGAVLGERGGVGFVSRL